MSSEQLEDILPGYSTYYPSTFREVIPYQLASLVYHQPFLAKLLEKNPKHPLFLQRVWTSGTLLRLKDKVEAGCNRHPVSKMTATGVPPNLVIANRLVDLQNDLFTMKKQFILKLEQLPEALKHSMLENFQINGTVPITHYEMQNMMKTSIDDLKTTIETFLRSLTLRDQGSSATVATAVVASPHQVRDIAHYTS